MKMRNKIIKKLFKKKKKTTFAKMLENYNVQKQMEASALRYARPLGGVHIPLESELTKDCTLHRG